MAPKAAKEKAPAAKKIAPKKTPTKKAAKDGKKPQKEKKEKDPNAPKRPMSAYFFFLADMRGKVKADQPDIKVTEISKVIGEMWGKASDKEKEKYQKKADEAKATYEKAKAAYDAKKK